MVMLPKATLSSLAVLASNYSDIQLMEIHPSQECLKIKKKKKECLKIKIPHTPTGGNLNTLKAKDSMLFKICIFVWSGL